MRQRPRLSCSLAVLGLVLAVATPPASAQKIDIEKAPKAVRDAFKAKFPGFTITGVKKEVDDGKPAFEIESKKDGMTVDALLKPDGSFITIEEQIKDANLPAAVAKAAKAKYKKARWEKVEEITTGDKITYELTVKKEGGETAVAIFDKGGKLVEEE